jgi:hypothetical protein
MLLSWRPAAFATQEERAAWPSSPTIEGGDTLVVRGRAFPPGCEMLEAHVQRRDNVVGVELRAVYTGLPCGAIVHSSAFEATVAGLAPGTYRVRIGVAGIEGRTEGSATIVGR